MYYFGSTHQPGEKLCASCKSPLPAVETWPGHTFLYCDKPECRAKAQAHPRRPYVFANTERCTAPGCNNFVPEGSYSPRSRRHLLVCSAACYHRRAVKGSTPRVCACCGMEYLGASRTTKTGLYFYSPEHAGRYRLQQTMKRFGIFQPLATEYLEGFAKVHYRDFRGVQCALLCFCEFLIDEGITDMEQVTPKTITRFLAWGVEKGRSAQTHVTYVSTFMKWLQIEERRQAANPVIPEMHYSPEPRHEPRPYEEEQMAFIWKLLIERGNARTRVLVAIGEEAGLRLGELTRLRLQDVDPSKQRVFVRLPNKGSRERYAFFHDKTSKYLKEWLAERDPDCGHDRLVHNTRGGPCTVEQIHDEFRSVLLKNPPRRKTVYDEGMEEWSIHRLRHTMASRLTSNGADAATVMAAGGWVTTQAMAGYARVNDTAARRGYDKAMESIRENKQPTLRSLSFSDYLQQFLKAG